MDQERFFSGRLVTAFTAPGGLGVGHRALLLHHAPLCSTALASHSAGLLRNFAGATGSLVLCGNAGVHSVRPVVVAPFAHRDRRSVVALLAGRLGDTGTGGAVSNDRRTGRPSTGHPID